MRKWILCGLCLALGGLVLAGCTDTGGAFKEKSYTADMPIRSVGLDVQDREIEVTPSGDGQVHIQYAESGKEYYEIACSDDGVLTMTAASSKGWTDYIGGKPPAKERKIVLQVPDGLLETLTLSTTNEDIALPDLSVTGSAALSCSGGNITFERLHVGEGLSLTVKNGDISGTVAGGYDDFSIQTEIKKGESTLPASKEGGEKALYVSCNNGDADIGFAD